MSSFFDEASLVFIPSGYKTSKAYSVKPSDGSGDLAFTRSNDTATRVGPDGLIEKVRTNQVLQSNTFSNAAWTKSNSTVTSGQAGYDGTTNAWLLNKTGSLGRVTQDVNTSGLKTFSLYAKAGTSNWTAITFTQAESFSYFNLSNGTLGTNFGSDIVARTITSVGSGWYRISISVNNTSTSVNVYVADSDGTVSGTSGNILIQAAQIEGGDIATEPILTTSAAVSVGPVANVPRLDYLNSSCPRLLLEPQRTNIALYSEQFDNAAWLKINTTATANAIASPDGTTNADKLIASAGNSNKVIYQSIAPVGTSTVSVFAKAGEFGGILIGTGTVGAFFNLTTGQFRTNLFSAPVSTSVTNYGNGWYRCSVTMTLASVDNLYIGPNDNVSNTFAITGNGTSGIYVWGAQVEAGAYATSYIPTLGSASTRGSDAASKTGISSLIGQTEGTIFFDGVINGVQNATTNIINTEKNVSCSFYMQRRTSSSQIGVGFIFSGTTTAELLGGTIALGQRFKAAWAYKSGSNALSINGVVVATSATTYTIPDTFDDIFINDPTTYFSYQEGENVNQVLLFKTRLSNADLAALTA